MSKSCKTNLAVVVTGLEVGGAERMLLKLLKTVDPEELQVKVYSLRKKGPLQSEFAAANIPVNTSFLGSPIQTLRDLRTFKPDIIQGWLPHGNLVAGVLKCFFWRSRVFFGVRQTLPSLNKVKPLTAFVVRLTAILSRLTSCLIYNTKAAVSEHRRLGFVSRRHLVIPNGFEIQRFKPNVEIYHRLRSELGLSKDTLIIGHVARFHPMKDHGGFFAAANELQKKLGDKVNVVFALAGKGIESSNKEYSSLIPETLRSRVFSLGVIKDTATLFPAFDILVLSSAFYEGFPNVLGEAMSCEVACITTDTGDCRDIVGECGLVVPPQNVSALAAAMFNLVNDKNLRHEMGVRGRERVSKEYSLDNIAKRFAEAWTS
jgi:glycosyltransferase involved in cell wall biosynthesis